MASPGFDGEVADRFSRLERQRQPGFEMYCHDCNKGLTYDTAEAMRSRYYCRDCLCDGCGEPFDRARRARVEHQAKVLALCPKCICCVCGTSTIGKKYLEVKGKKGQRVCVACGCEVCRAGVGSHTIDGKRHCSTCLCHECGTSLAGGAVEHNFLRYCPGCAPRDPSMTAALQEDVPKCAGCHKGMQGASLEFDGKFYHQRCLKCEGCRTPFEGGTVHVVADQLFCAACSTKTCATCGNPIGSDTSFKIGEAEYHEECFVCTLCGAAMPDGVCAIVDGTPHCPTCAGKPGVGVNPPAEPAAGKISLVCCVCNGELVDNVMGLSELSGKYHKKCFNCVNCSANLSTPNTRVYIGSDQPYCEACMKKLSGQ